MNCQSSLVAFTHPEYLCARRLHTDVHMGQTTGDGGEVDLQPRWVAGQGQCGSRVKVISSDKSDVVSAFLCSLRSTVVSRSWSR